MFELQGGLERRVGCVIARQRASVSVELKSAVSRQFGRKLERKRRGKRELVNGEVDARVDGWLSGAGMAVTVALPFLIFNSFTVRSGKAPCC